MIGCAVQVGFRKVLLVFAILAVFYGSPASRILAAGFTSVAASSDVSISQALDAGNSALKSEHYEEAKKSAKQVLSSSRNSDIRAKAYRLLITSVRAVDGYDVAIKVAKDAYSRVKAGQPFYYSDRKILSGLITDLAQRKAAYLRTIADQQYIIRSYPSTDRAADAALKIAEYNRALGPSKAVMSAYQDVVKNYPLTRASWKAAQEIAWLRSNGHGTPKNADKGKELESRLRSVADKSGLAEARKQAWSLACGTADFTPTYSDVLRLEAIIADMQDVPVVAADTTDKSTSNAAATTESSSDASKPSAAVDTKAPELRTSLDLGLAQLQPVDSIPAGSFRAGLPKVASKSAQTVVSRATSAKRNTTQPAPVKTDPVVTDPGSDPEPPGDDNPTIPIPKPKEPPFNQWTCAKEYRDAGNDKSKLANLIIEHTKKAKALLNSPVVEDKRIGLGIMLGAALCASDLMDDSHLALSICSEYVTSNLNIASIERYRYLSKSMILDKVVLIWLKAGRIQNAIDLLKEMLDEESSSNEADALRVRLAQVLVDQKRYQEAIDYLRGIDDAGDLAAAKQQIAELETKLKESGTK